MVNIARLKPLWNNRFSYFHTWNVLTGSPVESLVKLSCLAEFPQEEVILISINRY